MTELTANFNLKLPELRGDAEVWAEYWNENLVTIDALLGAGLFTTQRARNALIGLFTSSDSSIGFGFTAPGGNLTEINVTQAELDPGIVGTWGDSGHVVRITVDIHGCVTAVESVLIVAPDPLLVERSVDGTMAPRTRNRIRASDKTITFPVPADCEDGDRVWVRILPGVDNTTLAGDGATVDGQAAVTFGADLGPWSLEFELDKVLGDWACTSVKYGRVA